LNDLKPPANIYHTHMCNGDRRVDAKPRLLIRRLLKDESPVRQPLKRSDSRKYLGCHHCDRANLNPTFTGVANASD
jgi:hypothetical protein